ncbi:MAG: AMP-binding protein, partial [Rhodobacteraceae bacterium]|nr:AMP-binding protein [Paracoccaceae bacterium]
MAQPAPRFWSPRFDIETRADGTILMQQSEPLAEWGRCLPDRLVHWAWARPDDIFLARRTNGGAWRQLSFISVLASVRALGSGLLELGLGPERPLLILSENSLEHALIGLAAQYVGVPYAPVSPAYALKSQDFGKLKGIAELLKPGLIFAQDGARYAAAIAAIRRAGTAVVVVDNHGPLQAALRFGDLEGRDASPAADAAFEAITGATVAKYLFTSGSTGSPKAVINTQSMLMANMGMVADCFRFLEDHPPVFVDWAPWNHTASGNKVFNMALMHGGTFHIDDGKPAPGLIDQTIRNLREISPTWYFNVPAGWDMLVREMERDAALCQSFFARLDMMMYAGAGMAQHTWDALRRLSRRHAGREVLLVSGLGATETAPAALMCTEQWQSAGNIGVPERGLILKLVPNGGKLEARLKGPSITPGYFGDPERTAQAFDDEGFYLLGDALKPADPDDLSRGFFFDGRVAENFKLATGTWVAVGALRAALVNAFGGLVSDAVILGENRE